MQATSVLVTAISLIAAAPAIGAIAIPAGTPQDAGSRVLRAPYQIDSVQRTKELYNSVPVEVVVVALGRAGDRHSPNAGIPLPNDDDLTWMTILGTRGFVHASRSAIERRCEHLCGDDMEECHWVGLYGSPASLDAIGDPVAALPGRLNLTDYVGLADVRAAADPLAGLAPGDSAQALLWGPWDDGEAHLSVTRWDPSGGAFAGELRFDGHASPLVAEGCESSSHDWLLEIDCGSFALLASGDRPLLLSWADYNLPKVEPLARFTHNGSRHYAVRFGAKAQDVVGLVSAEPAGWRARFRPRDWALIC